LFNSAVMKAHRQLGKGESMIEGLFRKYIVSGVYSPL
jgi:hypothetical protein